MKKNDLTRDLKNIKIILQAQNIGQFCKDIGRLVKPLKP